MDIHQSSTKFIHQAVVMLSCPDATGGEILRHSQVNARMDSSQAGSSPELLLDMTFWKWCRDERIVENDENGISIGFHDFMAAQGSWCPGYFKKKVTNPDDSPQKRGTMRSSVLQLDKYTPGWVNLSSSGIWIRDMCMFPNIAHACSHAHKHKDTHTHTLAYSNKPHSNVVCTMCTCWG